MSSFEDDGDFVVIERDDTSNPSLPSASKSGPRLGDSGYTEHRLAKKGNKIQAWIKVLEVDTGVNMDRSKTIGTITMKNSNDILMCAHSGYSTGLTREDQSLDTKRWNSLTLNHLARQIQFRFPKSNRDNNGRPILDEHHGRVHAGHVEVLLACFYVVHVARQNFDFAEESEESIIRQLKLLRDANLGDARAAYITIDSQPCRPCLQFIHKLSQYTRIGFTLIDSQGIGPIQVRIDGQRRRDVVGDVFIDSEDDITVEEASRKDVVPKERSTPYEGVRRSQDAINHSTTTTRLIPRRPAGREPVTRWAPVDPEAFVAPYKKKTPEFEHPGYSSMPMSVAIRPKPSAESAAAADVICIEDEDEEVEDDDSASSTISSDSIHDDLEELAGPSFQQQENEQELEDDGHMYAYSAYQMFREPSPIEETQGMDHEVVVEGSQEDNLPNPPTPIRSTAAWPRLSQFRHLVVDDIDESMFRRKYSILRPKDQNQTS